MKTFVFFLSFFMVFFFSVPISAENQPSFIIDAGHGGTDGGAVGLDGTLEKRSKPRSVSETCRTFLSCRYRFYSDPFMR